MMSMRLRLERLNVDELDFQVKVPPELELSECARTRPVEDFLSCARTLALKGVRKEKPHFGELPIRPQAHRKKHGSLVVYSPILSEPLSHDQNVDLNCPSTNAEKRVTFSDKCDILGFSDSHYDDIEPVLNDLSELVDVGVYRHLEKAEERSLQGEEQLLVSFNRSQFSKCVLHVKTDGIFSSRGVQVDEGLFIDKEVMDSYLHLKMSDALSDLKHEFVTTETKVAKVLREKEILEEVLKKKMQCIKDLSLNSLSKPTMKDQGSMTDGNPVDMALTSSSVSAQEIKEKGEKKKSIGSQTDQNVLMDIIKFSTPSQTSHSPLQINSGPVTKSESEDAKIGWMFSKLTSCARCHALRPQVRLLRALKRNMIRKGVWKPGTSYVLKDGIIPDKMIWEALGFRLQSMFVRLVRLCQLLEALPLDSFLKVKSDSLTMLLNHLMSHLPLPSNVRQNNDTLRISSVQDMSLYLFGYKLKELTQLLRFLRSGRFAVVFPYYFRAEIAVLERFAHRTLACALEDMHHKCIEGSSLDIGAEFISKHYIENDHFNDDDDVNDFLSINCGTDELDDSLPMKTPKKPITEKCEAQISAVCKKKWLFGRKIFKSRTGHNQSPEASHSDLSCSESPSHQVQWIKSNLASPNSGVTPLGTSEVALNAGSNQLKSCSASILNNISQDGAVQEKILVQTDVTQSPSMRTGLSTQSFGKPVRSLLPLLVHSIPLATLKVTSVSESFSDSVCLNTSKPFMSQPVEPSMILSASNTDTIVSCSVAPSLSTGSVSNAKSLSATSGGCMYTALANLLTNSASTTAHSLSVSKMSVQNMSRYPTHGTTVCSTLSEHSYSKAMAYSNGWNTVKNRPVTVQAIANVSSDSSFIASGLFAGNQAPVSNFGKKFTQYVSAPNSNFFSGLSTEMNTSLQPKPASCTITQLPPKVGIGSTPPPFATTTPMLNARLDSLNSRTTSSSANVIASLLPSFDITSTSTSLGDSSSSTAQAIFGSSMISIPSTSNEIKLPPTRTLAHTKNQKLKIGKPKVLNSGKQNNKIFLTWTFAKELHPHVAKYIVYFCGLEFTEGVCKKWCKFGRVEPCPLPMTLTLTFTDIIVNCILSVKAIFSNGQCSDLSDVAIV